MDSCVRVIKTIKYNTTNNIGKKIEKNQLHSTFWHIAYRPYYRSEFPKVCHNQWHHIPFALPHGLQIFDLVYKWWRNQPTDSSFAYSYNFFWNFDELELETMRIKIVCSNEIFRMSFNFFYSSICDHLLSKPHESKIVSCQFINNKNHSWLKKQTTLMNFYKCVLVCVLRLAYLKCCRPAENIGIRHNWNVTSSAFWWRDGRRGTLIFHDRGPAIAIFHEKKTVLILFWPNCGGFEYKL